MTDLPSYAELPAAPEGGRSAWRIFGEDDCVGLLNLQTPERIAAAARLIQRGVVFPLDAALDHFTPALATGRGVPRQTVLHTPGTIGFDDVLDNFFPQASSQWDSLGHVGYSTNAFYNGASEDDVASGRRNTIDHWARRGIAGRAVLLDLASTHRAVKGEYDPGASTRFDVSDLEAARERSGIEYQPGDVLILHTGFAHWYAGQDMRVRMRLPRELRAPGIGQSEEMAAYLWDSHVSAIGCDTFAVEAWPPSFDPSAGPFGFMHRMLIGQFGMALGELWWLHELADDCARDGVYEMFFTSAPLNSRGGIGSPPNALAIK